MMTLLLKFLMQIPFHIHQKVLHVCHDATSGQRAAVVQLAHGKL